MAIGIRKRVSGDLDVVHEIRRSEANRFAIGMNSEIFKLCSTVKGRQVNGKLGVAEYRWQVCAAKIDTDERSCPCSAA